MPGRGSMQSPGGTPIRAWRKVAGTLNAATAAARRRRRGEEEVRVLFPRPSSLRLRGPEHGTLRRLHAAAQAADFRHGMKDHLVANVAPCDRPVENGVIGFCSHARPRLGRQAERASRQTPDGRGSAEAADARTARASFAGLRFLPRPERTPASNDRPATRPGSTRPGKARVSEGVAQGTRSDRWHLRPARSFPHVGGTRWRRTNAGRGNDKGTAQVQGLNARQPQYSG